MIDERTLVLWLAISLSSPSTVKAFVEGLYCGRQSCYDVLGVTRDSSKQEISKAYRKLAIKYHPDKVKGDEEAKKEAQKKFQKIATAYETLKDDEARNDYDYMLDNPEEMYRHYYYYYRRRLSPKVDVRIVILVAILAVSIVQYVSAWHKYNEAVAYLLTDPKYRLKATEMAREQGLLTNLNKKGQRRDKKEQIKEQEEAIIRQVIEENVDIHGGYRKPKVYDVCAFQLVFLPWYLVQLIYFYAKWFWKFGICRHEYGDEEKLYLIRRNFGMSEVQFNAMSEHEKEDYLELELWQNSKFAEWKAAKEESERQKLLSRSGAYKRQLRYMRKGGAGQITFLDDE